MFLLTLFASALIIVIICAWWGSSILTLGAWLGLRVEGSGIGDWGDSFSGLNAGFSGLAVLGVGATLYLQMQLSKGQAIANGKAEFERIFFQLFQLIRQLRDELTFDPALSKTSTLGQSLVSQKAVSPDHKRGVAAIKLAYHEIDKRMSRINFDATAETNKKAVAKIYNVVVNRRHEPEFSPYFRVIYSLLRRIDTSRYLTEEERLDYSRLLRSQMTSQEVALLGLNALSPQSRDLKEYIIKYRMLKYAQAGSIRDRLRQIYPSSTFEGRHGIGNAFAPSPSRS